MNQLTSSTTGAVVGTVPYHQDLEYYKKLNNLLTIQLNTKADLPASFRHIICRNTSYINLLQKAAKAAPTDAAVCITGERGAGKKLIAEAIHYSSGKSSGPLVKIHCAAIPESQYEAELFGCERVSLSGARQNGRLGKLELAHNGTLLLEGVGEMPLRIQAKLLRVLQEKEIERMGGTKRLKTDFRLITTSTRELSEQVAAGTFREDLFYRLNVIPVHVPALRERREDIPELTKLFLEALHKAYDRRALLSKAALTSLSAYDWPGNVQELKNLLEQVYILLPDTASVIEPVHLPVQIARNVRFMNENGYRSSFNLNDIIERAEKDAIQSALQMTNNNRSQAIEILGISRRNFYLKLKKYEITR